MTGILKVDTIQNANADNIITQTNSTTLTIGASGDTVTLAAGATSSGFGATYNGAVNWDTTPKTTTVTAVSGVGYFVDTTTTTLTVNLPAGVAGSIVAVSDYANTAATNNISITPNGTDKINGGNFTYKISTNGAAISLVYVDATRGWKDINDATLDATGLSPFVVATGGTILTCGDFKTHVFTGPGTFTVTSAGTPAGSNSVEYLVVAGGGAGGNGDVGAGAGAGGYRQNYPSPTTAGLPVTSQGYPITVGSGGAGVAFNFAGNSGNPSIFSTITSTGGGGGGGGPGSSGDPLSNGKSGGSGGGGAWDGGSPGAGNTPPVSPSQGNSGGAQSGAGPLFASAGGGGASGSGTPGTCSTIGNGGAGSPIATTVFGPTSPSYGTPGPAPGRYFAGGGSGTSDGGTSGTAGAGGGGTKGVNGSTNTGGGGGGLQTPGTSGSGGSGIVVIRYKFQ